MISMSICIPYISIYACDTSVSARHKYISATHMQHRSGSHPSFASTSKERSRRLVCKKPYGQIGIGVGCAPPKHWHHTYFKWCSSQDAEPSAPNSKFMYNKVLSGAGTTTLGWPISGTGTGFGSKYKCWASDGANIDFFGNWKKGGVSGVSCMQLRTWRETPERARHARLSKSVGSHKRITPPTKAPMIGIQATAKSKKSVAQCAAFVREVITSQSLAGSAPQRGITPPNEG